jgi:hypothetical protein
MRIDAYVASRHAQGERPLPAQNGRQIRHPQAIGTSWTPGLARGHVHNAADQPNADGTMHTVIVHSEAAPMAYVDLAELKARLPIEEAIARLDLTLTHAESQHCGPCPTCRRGGPRALAIMPAKNAFYCFGARIGGDVIALAAHIRDCEMKEAACFLADEEQNDAAPESGGSAKVTGPDEKTKGSEERRLLKPLAYLEPAHPKVQALGLTDETCRAVGAGNAPKGILRGRLAIPIHDWRGELIAYCGQAVSDDSPALIFPNSVRPEGHLFNAHQAGEGELILARDPLKAAPASQNGVDNIVAPLTDGLSAEQLQAPAAHMNERGCENVAIH